MSSRDLVYVTHIAERIARIEEDSAGGWEIFVASHIVQDAVMRNFEVIGDAARRLSPDPRARYAEVPWRSIAGFRDVLIHDYMGVDLRQVWNVVEQELPRLKSAIHAMQRELENAG